MKNKILFLVGFILLLLFFTQLMKTPEDLSVRGMKEYRNNNVTYDILGLGSSHIYCSIRTDIIERETDQTAYNLSHSNQLLMQSYFLLKNTIQENRIPKLVILDLYGITGGKSYKSIDAQTFSLALMGLSDTNICKEYLSFKNTKEYPLPIMNIHNNWKYINFEIIKNNFGIGDNKQEQRKRYNGYIFEKEEVNLEKKGINFEEIKNNIKNREYFKIKCYYKILKIREDELNYALKIKDLCLKHNIKFIPIMAPAINWTYENKKYEKLIKEPLSKQFPNYIEFNDYNLLKEIGIELGKDFRDNGHLSDSGSLKLTNYLLKLLKD